jgi:hypothetical protein
MRIFILEPTNALAGGVHATAKFNQMVVRLTMQMPAPAQSETFLLNTFTSGIR